MPRRLSNIEWATFLHDVDVNRLNLPSWGGAVDWGGLQILVFHGASGEWFLTDISDSPQLIAGYPATQDPWGKVWLYSLPEATMESIKEAPGVIASAVVATATEVGKTAGVLTGPLLSNLTVPLIVVGIIGLVLLVREARI